MHACRFFSNSTGCLVPISDLLLPGSFFIEQQIQQYSHAFVSFEIGDDLWWEIFFFSIHHLCGNYNSVFRRSGRIPRRHCICTNNFPRKFLIFCLKISTNCNNSCWAIFYIHCTSIKFTQNQVKHIQEEDLFFVVYNNNFWSCSLKMMGCLLTNERNFRVTFVCSFLAPCGWRSSSRRPLASPGSLTGYVSQKP